MTESETPPNTAMKIRIKIKASKTEAVKSSAEIVASIYDLLTEILLRLPIKSLIRFKLVSKHWLSLITSSKFCLLRSSNPSPTVGMFLLSFDIPWYEYVPFSSDKPTNPPFTKLNFTKDSLGLMISQSCNGLLLCCSFRAFKRCYVYNPTTNKFFTLPKSDVGDGISNRMLGMSLAFDPAKSPHYKVVCVRIFKLEYEECQYQCEIYSSETGRWGKCGGPFTAEINFANGVYWSGAVHWIGYKPENSLYLNLDDEMLEKMPMPPNLDGWERSHYYFGESCDHLHYIEIFGQHSVEFDVYEMKRDHSEWFVKYHVDLSPIVSANPGMNPVNFEFRDHYCYSYSVFTLVRDEREEDSFLILHIPGKAIRYNFVDKTFETVCGSKGSEFKHCLKFPSKFGFQYIESLCCV